MHVARPMACMTVAWQPQKGLQEMEGAMQPRGTVLLVVRVCKARELVAAAAAATRRRYLPLWVAPRLLRRVTGYECSSQRTSTRGRRLCEDAGGWVGTGLGRHVLRKVHGWLGWRPKNLLCQTQQCEMERDAVYRGKSDGWRIQWRGHGSVVPPAKLEVSRAEGCS